MPHELTEAVNLAQEGRRGHAHIEKKRKTHRARDGNRFETLRIDEAEAPWDEAEKNDGFQSGEERVASSKKSVERSTSKKQTELAAASGSAFRAEGPAKMDFAGGGRMCSMKFFDADVQRSLVSVSAVVDEENIVVF